MLKKQRKQLIFLKDISQHKKKPVQKDQTFYTGRVNSINVVVVAVAAPEVVLR